MATAHKMAHTVLGEIGNAVNSWESLAPFVWIVGGVQYAVDCHCACCILAEDHIWETTHKFSAVLLVESCIHLGHTTDGHNTRIDAA